MLPLIDGHESHKFPTFQNLCEKDNVITARNPPHFSPILQPLEVGCFAPLKRAYSKEIRAMATNTFNHIDERAFSAFIARVFELAFSKANTDQASEQLIWSPVTW